MTKCFTAYATGLAFLLAGGSIVADVSALHAQQRLIEISPDDTVLVERYVEAAPERPIVEDHMTLRPGSVIPPAVPLRHFGDVAALRNYVYFLSVDHKIVVADPETRVVVRILDMKS